jgi:hypothetical protein
VQIGVASVFAVGETPVSSEREDPDRMAGQKGALEEHIIGWPTVDLDRSQSCSRYASDSLLNHSMAYRSSSSASARFSFSLMRAR